MFVENREKWLENMISFDRSWINKYTYRGDMGLPDSIFCIKPIFDSCELHKTLEESELIKGTRTQSMIITDTIIGSLCYRNFDPKYTKTYDRLVKRNHLQGQNKIEY